MRRVVPASLAGLCAALVVAALGCSQPDASAGVHALVAERTPQSSAAAAAPAAPASQAAPAAAPIAEPAAAAAPTADSPPAAQSAAPPNTITPRPAAKLTRDQVDELADSVAELRTSQGTVVIGFLPGKAPNTVKNFVDLAQQHFYDGTKIHRVIPGMFIQGGDPTGTGDGGPGYFIPAEFNDEPHVRGTVSMARLRHPDSAGSQFFICLAPLPYLDGGYTAFGRVLSGDEVLDRIEKLGRATPQGTPTETITLEQVLIRPRSPAERPTASHP
jgi:peptidyl-prolyl cis-trans isomerase B (cyclophilin B)